MDLVTYLIIFITSIIASYSFLGTMIVTVIKDLGDNGYILDYDSDKDEELDNNLDDDTKKLNKLLLITPLINILYSLYMCYIYTQNKQLIFNLIGSFDSVREMTDEEKKAYEENKSFLLLLGASAINKNKDNDSQDKEPSIIDNTFYEEFKENLKENGYFENDDKSEYFAVSNYLYKTKSCFSFKDNCFNDMNEARSYYKSIVDTIAEQLKDENYIKFDFGYFIKNSVNSDDKFEEFSKHILSLYSNYNCLKELSNRDVSDEIISLTKDNTVFLSFISNGKLHSFVLLYDIFIDELKQHGLTVTGIDNLSFKEFVMRLLDEKTFSMPVAISKKELDCIYYNEEFNSDNKDEDKPKVMVKKENKEKKKN